MMNVPRLVTYNLFPVPHFFGFSQNSSADKLKVSLFGSKHVLGQLPNDNLDEILVIRELPNEHLDEILVNRELPNEHSDGILVNRKLPNEQFVEILVNRKLPNEQLDKILVNRKLPLWYLFNAFDAIDIVHHHKYNRFINNHKLKN